MFFVLLYNGLAFLSNEWAKQNTLIFLRIRKKNFESDIMTLTLSPWQSVLCNGCFAIANTITKYANKKLQSFPSCKNTWIICSIKQIVWSRWIIKTNHNLVFFKHSCGYSEGWIIWETDNTKRIIAISGSPTYIHKVLYW